MSGVFENVSEARECVFSALMSARKEISSLSDTEDEMGDSILKMGGMSGRKWRHFLNNIVGSKEGLKYLEVGSWLGSTFCSSLYKNDNLGLMVGIDNYSQFIGSNANDIRQAFIDNVSNVSTKMSMLNSEITKEWVQARIKFYQCDFEEFDFEGLKSEHLIDVYLFDGPHKAKDQYNGIVKAYPALADVCVVLVDDWNWQGPREGTYKAFKELGVTIEHQFEIFTPPDGYIPADDKLHFLPNRFAGSEWHNGVAIFVISK